LNKSSRAFIDITPLKRLWRPVAEDAASVHSSLTLFASAGEPGVHAARGFRGYRERKATSKLLIIKRLKPETGSGIVFTEILQILSNHRLVSACQ